MSDNSPNPSELYDSEEDVQILETFLHKSSGPTGNPSREAQLVEIGSPSKPELSFDFVEEKISGTIPHDSSDRLGNESREAEEVEHNSSNGLGKESREVELEEMINLADEKDPRNITVLVGQEEEGISRFILSRFLVRLSSSDFQNLIGDPSVKELAITEVDGATFQQIINYTSLRSDWTFDGSLIQAYNLKEAARRFHLDELEEEILRQVPELKCEEDFLRILCKILNEKRSEKDLKLRDAAMNYVSSHADQFLQREEFFLLLSSDALSEMLSKEKHPLSSLELFKLLLRWGIASCKRDFQFCRGRFLREKIQGLLKFINFFNMTNRTLKRLQGGTAKKCQGDGMSLHPIPQVIEPFTKEVFSFEWSRVKGKKSQPKERLSCTFLYGFEAQPQKLAYFAVKFVIQEGHGIFGLAFVDSPDIHNFPDRRSSNNKFGRAALTGGIIKLILENDSIRVCLNVNVLMEERAKMDIQVLQV